MVLSLRTAVGSSAAAVSLGERGRRALGCVNTGSPQAPAPYLLRGADDASRARGVRVL